MAYIPTFSDWNSVAQYFGPQVAQTLQQNNVPLNQVGQIINQASPNFNFGAAGSGISAGFQAGGSDPGLASGGVVSSANQNLNQSLGQFFGGGGGSGQQGQQTAPTGPGGPNAPLYNLGAAALQGAGFGANYGATPVYNPTPASQPNPQSGVGQIQGPTYGTPLSATALAAMQKPGQPLGLYTPGGGFNPGMANQPLTLPSTPATPAKVYGGVTSTQQPTGTFGQINQPALYGANGPIGTTIPPTVPPPAPGNNMMMPNAPRPGLSVRNYTAGAMNVSPPNPNPQALQVGPPNPPVGSGLTAGQTPTLGTTPTAPAAPGYGHGGPFGTGLTASGQPMSQGQQGAYGAAQGIGAIGSAVASAFSNASKAYGQGAANIGKIQSGIPNPNQFQQPSQSGIVNPYNPFNERQV